MPSGASTCSSTAHAHRGFEDTAERTDGVAGGRLRVTFCKILADLNRPFSSGNGIAAERGHVESFAAAKICVRT